MPSTSWNTGAIIVCLIGIGACGGLDNAAVSTLRPPGGAAPDAAASMQQGNRAFAAGQWADARARYEHAIKTQPTLAEAHYNLALTLDRLGRQPEADDHYIRAANLAPGHSVIWNSRKLRRYGDVTVKPKSGAAPVLPAIGSGSGGIGRGF